MERTVPTILYMVGAIYLWYFEHGDPPADVARAKAVAPWSPHKAEPSFVDMLNAVRRDLLGAPELSTDPLEFRIMQEFLDPLEMPMPAMDDAAASGREMAKL